MMAHTGRTWLLGRKWDHRFAGYSESVLFWLIYVQRVGTITAYFST